MAPKRKAPTNSDGPSISKRQKLNTDAIRYPCQLCTSPVPEDVITIRATTKGKPAQDLTAHKRCMEVIPEVDLKQKKITKGDLPGYKSRFKLKCDICSDSHGAKIQCTVPKCTHAYHINCATQDHDHGILFDTTTETYGLVPWYLFCKRHNAERLRNSASKTLPSPASSGRALSLSASPPRSSSAGSVRGSDHEGDSSSRPLAMVTPPETIPGSPVLAASPVHEEMADPGDEATEASTSTTSNVVLTPEQIKLVSDFLFTDPTWDAFLQEMVAGQEASTSRSISVQ